MQSLAGVGGIKARVDRSGGWDAAMTWPQHVCLLLTLWWCSLVLVPSPTTHWPPSHPHPARVSRGRPGVRAAGWLVGGCHARMELMRRICSIRCKAADRLDRASKDVCGRSVQIWVSGWGVSSTAPLMSSPPSPARAVLSTQETMGDRRRGVTPLAVVGGQRLQQVRRWPAYHSLATAVLHSDLKDSRHQHRRLGHKT